MHDYLSKAKSSNFHYFVLSIGTVRGNPYMYLLVVAGEKLMLHHSFNIHSGIIVLEYYKEYKYIESLWLRGAALQI